MRIVNNRQQRQDGAVTNMRLPSIEQTGIGVIVPCDMVLDRELWRWTPADVSLHVTRLPPTPTTVTVETVTLMGDHDLVAASVAQLAAVSPAATLYACTSGSFMRGLHGERALVAAMQAAGAAAPVTTSGALLAALGQVGAQTVSIATPYDEAISLRLREFLEEAGAGVAGTHWLGLQSNIGTVPYDVTADLIRKADHPDAEAIIVSCTNMATYDLIEPLEAELGKPVISANQGSMWAALGLVGRAAAGPGQRLLDHDRVASPLESRRR